MRVVYDTNVAATILLRRGKVIKLKQLVKSGKVTIITSEYILDELAEVLHLRLGMTKQRAKANLRVFAKVAEIVKPTNIEAVSRDPGDDYILATAVSGNADCIVSLDNDLLILKSYKSILIVSPDKFSRLLKDTQT